MSLLSHSEDLAHLGRSGCGAVDASDAPLLLNSVLLSQFFEVWVF